MKETLKSYGLHKGFGAGLGNCAQVEDHLLPCHADAGVFHRHGARLSVRCDLDAEL